MTTQITAWPTDWIRPWYPAGPVGHLFPDCEELQYWEGSEPHAGTGWLNPHQGEVCESCIKRHDESLWDELFGETWDAVCDTCDASLSGDRIDRYTAKRFGEEHAKTWAAAHQCEPETRVITRDMKPRPKKRRS